MPEPVLTEIDHVAIAVRDLEGAVDVLPRHVRRRPGAP